MEFHCYDCTNDLLAPWIKCSFPENQIPKELVFFFFFFFNILCTKQAVHLIYGIKMKVISLIYFDVPQDRQEFFSPLVNVLATASGKNAVSWEESGATNDNKITCHSTKSNHLVNWPYSLFQSGRISSAELFIRKRVLAPPTKLVLQGYLRGSYRYL